MDPELISTLKGHTASITSIDFNPNMYDFEVNFINSPGNN